MKNLIKLVAMMAFVLGCNDLQAGTPGGNSWRDNTISNQQQQDVVEFARIRAMVEDLNQQPVNVRLDTRIVFDENGQPDLVVDNNN